MAYIRCHHCGMMARLVGLILPGIAVTCYYSDCPICDAPVVSVKARPVSEGTGE